jgi:hypothetical protein
MSRYCCIKKLPGTGNVFRTIFKIQYSICQIEQLIPEADQVGNIIGEGGRRFCKVRSMDLLGLSNRWLWIYIMFSIMYSVHICRLKILKLCK